MQYTAGGFWIAFFASVVLVVQSVFLRTTSDLGLAAGYTRAGGWLRRLKFLDDPRFVRAVSFLFRFQSIFGLVIVIAMAVMFSPVRNGNNLFLSQRNLSNVARDVAETGVLATGQILVIILGGIDLSVSSVVALTATGIAFLLMRDLMPAIPAILLILGLGLAIGWWNGWTSERFKIPPFVVTLAMLSIARGLAHIWSSDIAVPISYGAGGADPLFEVIGERINGVFPVPAIIMLLVAIIMSLVLHYTSFGRHLYAIGGNQTAARLSGVAVSRIKIVAFMLCSFFAAMAGIMHAAQLNQGSPNEAVGYEMNAIAAVVIGGASLAGGRGTIAGAIAGAFILGILDNMLSLNNVNSNMQLVTKGLIVVGAVALQQFRPRSAE
ncbi:MAG: ABC transporter permease [Anaerolineae bacterium]|nr:ABC transporter permease [Anaerolineae bacterium]